MRDAERSIGRGIGRLAALVAGLVALGALAQIRGTPPFKSYVEKADGGVAVSTRVEPPLYPSDGGQVIAPSVISTTDYACGAASTNSLYTLDSGVLAVGVLTQRVYIEVCNSRDNAYSQVRCRSDGVAPVNSVGTLGELLNVGECVTYGNPGGRAVQCIGNAGTSVTTYECAP